MSLNRPVTRRGFIVASASLGGGLAVGISLPGLAKDAAQPADSRFQPWLTIDPDNTITMHNTMPEMGTGASSQFAMTIAEELECDWSDVQVDYATLHADDRHDKVLSKSTEGGYAWFSGRSTLTKRNETLLSVGASARERLKLAAGQLWKVPASEITAENSVLRHGPSGRKVTFGEVAALAATVELSSEPALKPRSEWKLLGKKTPTRLHVPKVTNGTLKYGIDARPEGMCYAAIRQCPVQDGRIKSVDTEAIKSMPGVRGVAIIEGGEPLRRAGDLLQPVQLSTFNDPRTSAVAVVADHYWQARKALDALPVEWDYGEGTRWSSNEMVLDTALDMLEGDDGTERLRMGEPEKALAEQARVIEAIYHTPYCDQAPIEPLNGTCLFTEKRLDLWHSSQFTDTSRAAAVEESGLDPEDVYIHQMSVGGAFGRRNCGDDVRMVVAVARQFPGMPVQVIWSREETMRQGRYRALMAAKLTAGLDEEGSLKVLNSRVVGRPLAARAPASWERYTPLTSWLADSPYAVALVPNVSSVTWDLPIHIRSGPYRGPYYNSNVFFLESFIDECAHAAGMDELDYRLKLFEKWPDKGWSAVLKVAAEKAGWGEALPEGMARGIAIGNFGMFGRPHAATTAATVATVEVTRKGEIKVHGFDVAFDCGSYMNLDAVRAQLEGATIHGYNMAMNETLTIEDGRIVEGNFDRYPLVRMAEMPPVRVHTGAVSGHERFGEPGEVATGTVGPAIANAIFKITGKRVRSTPLRGHDLSWG